MLASFKKKEEHSTYCIYSEKSVESGVWGSKFTDAHKSCANPFSGPTKIKTYLGFSF